MRRLRSGVKNPPLGKLIPLIAVLIPIFIGAIFLKSSFFKIHLINLNLSQINCTDEQNIKDKSNILNKNIFFVDEKNTKLDLKNKFICIKDIQFTKSLPDKILMNVKGRIPVAELISIPNFESSTSAVIENIATPSASLDETYLADDDGVVFAKGFADVSKIYFLGKTISIKEKQDEYLNKTLFILKLFKELGIDNSKVYIIDNFLITNSHPKVAFLLNKEREEQIASLQLILQKAKIDNKELEFIDLRFDKPIIKYAPKK